MDNMRLSGMMYILAGGFFILSGFIGGNIIYLPLGAVIILLGLRKMKQDRPGEEQE